MGGGPELEPLIVSRRRSSACGRRRSRLRRPDRRALAAIPTRISEAPALLINSKDISGPGQFAARAPGCWSSSAFGGDARAGVHSSSQQEGRRDAAKDGSPGTTGHGLAPVGGPTLTTRASLHDAVPSRPERE
jgi:hypothetical protein